MVFGEIDCKGRVERIRPAQAHDTMVVGTRKNRQRIVQKIVTQDRPPDAYAVFRIRDNTVCQVKRGNAQVTIMAFGKFDMGAVSSLKIPWAKLEADSGHH